MDRVLVCFKSKLALARIQTRLRRTPYLLRSQPKLHRYLECLHKLFATLSTLTVLSLLSGAVSAQSAADLQPGTAHCMQCIRVRVGLPRVVRGPAADIADNRFSEIQRPSGGFRGFDAHGDTRLIDGRYPRDIGGRNERCSLPVSPERMIPADNGYSMWNPPTARSSPRSQLILHAVDDVLRSDLRQWGLRRMGFVPNGESR
jgi:hypothetical protein